MKKSLLLLALVSGLLGGCATINSIPYKASVDNVIAIQQIAGNNKTIAVGNFTFANGVSKELTCRAVGPVKVDPEDMSEYIKKAFQEELFMAKVYSPQSTNVINGEITSLDFSSISPAQWNIGLRVSANGVSYNTKINHGFSTSWDAINACKNTANAFGGAVSKLIKEVVANPQFARMIK